MKKTSLILAVIALAAACRTGPEVKPGPAFQVFPAQPGSRVQLAFAPPLTEALVERSVTRRTETPWAAGKAQQRVESQVELETVSSWEKVEDGLVLTQAVRSVSAVQQGTKIDDPLVQLVTRFPTRFQFAADGTFVRFLNPADAERAVRETFSDREQAETVLGFFTPAAIEEQGRVEWEQKFGGLFGQPLEVGRPGYVVDGTALGQLPMLYVVERALVGTAKTPFGDAAVLELRCVQSPEAAKDRQGFEALLAERGNPTLEPTVSCDGRQLVTKDRFVPVSLELRVRGRPLDAEGAVVGELDLVRTVRAEALEARK